MTKQLFYLLRVRYAECDAQNIVFNAKYVEYIDVAVSEYIRVLFGDYKKLLERGLDLQVVNINVSWQAPATYDDVVALAIKLKKMGTTSFTLTVDFSNYLSKKSLAVGEITYVMVSPRDHVKTPIPADVRSLMEKGVSGLVNHAGIVIDDKQ